MMSMSTSRGSMTREQQNWVWITREEYYLDADGNEAEHLDPESGLGGEGL